MKNKFFNFCEKFIAGGYETKIGDTYVGTPKIAPIFLVAFITATIGQLNELPVVTYIGFTLTAVGIFGFFYYNLFPSRRPKGPFDK
jgi:hypothetical protein